MIDIFSLQRFYFIGIGGISMASLALCLNKFGKTISGSDINLEKSPLYDKLTKTNITLHTTHNKKNVKNCDIVVFTGAIPKNNCEIQQAKKLNIPVLERSEFLGLFCDIFNSTIAISGSHGKTTTTALIGHIFYKAKLKPSIHIGGIARNFNSSFVIGDKNYFITEACEFRRSFLKIIPSVSIITNIDADHLDCYKNIDDIKYAFKLFASQTKDLIVFNGDNIDKEIFKDIKTAKLSFGFNQNNDYYIKKYKKYFVVYKHNEKLLSSHTKLLGEYNLLNILAAVVVADFYKIDKNIVQKSIASFLGVKRRFEFIKKVGKSDLYKDYAHHPTEIKALLDVCKSLNYKKIIAIFQPHTYSRTKALFDDFLNCFGDCDELALIPTYSAREKVINGGKSQDLFNAIKKIRSNAYFLNNKNDVQEFIRKFSKIECLIVLIGAGDIENFFE